MLFWLVRLLSLAPSVPAACRLQGGNLNLPRLLLRLLSKRKPHRQALKLHWLQLPVVAKAMSHRLLRYPAVALILHWLQLPVVTKAVSHRLLRYQAVLLRLLAEFSLVGYLCPS